MSIERRTPLSVLLTIARRTLSAQLMAGLRAAGFSDLRAAHGLVFTVLQADGSRLTDLAARAGMTKQAMSELVQYLEQHGYLRIEPDPRDQRAKVIRPTGLGRSARKISIALQADSERRLKERIGAQAVLDLRRRLMRIGPDQDL